VPKRSAGLLLYRRGRAGIELLIVHPGGPFWARKDDGAWSVPKGEYTEEEDPERAAVREFEEELGRAAPEGPRLDLGVVTQAGGKRVHVFAVEGEFDVATTVSNTFEIEWPPRSGRTGVFPEVDRVCWFTPDEARRRLLRGQVPLVDRLLEALGSRPDD
jgi:predicted NUDIX family NTP pyrophosphohydrolase